MRIDAPVLRNVGYALFQAAGCPTDRARLVVDHLVDSNLYGHDSHGVIRIPQYLGAIREGLAGPTRDPVVVRDAPSAAVVDAKGGLGQVGATYAARLAMSKARQHGVATVTLRNTGHIGRVGAYALMAARAGMIGQVFVNNGRQGYHVATSGGIEGRLSTNPIAFAAPCREAPPVLVDMTTSVVPEGKIRVALSRSKGGNKSRVSHTFPLHVDKAE